MGLTDHQTGGSLYALDATTGGLLWKTKVTEATNKFPCDCFDAGAVANGVVYVQHDGLLEAFNASTGKGLFKGKDLGLSSSPAIANGFVYVSSSQTVYAYKPFP